MKGTQAYAQLKKLGVPVFKTQDAAALFQMKLDASNKILTRLAHDQNLIKLRRGLWCFPETDPYLIPEYLTAPAPCYLSLQTALFLHGMISQVPQVIYLVSTARSKRWQTPKGVFSVHHLPAEFLFGFEVKGEKNYKLALPEKALLDFFYLKPARSRLFASLPELVLPRNFKKKRLKNFLKKIPSTRRQIMVSQEFERVIKQSAH
jgi:predicted transcriptional regulator of viral defense system